MEYFIARIVLISIPLFFINAAHGETERADRITIAKFNQGGSLVRPTNVDEWVFLGGTVGHGYTPEGLGEAFSLSNPGLIQVIQMEPSAYKYFKKMGRYADGTMLSLSFYNILDNPRPTVDGFIQGSLNTFEIHLIDKVTFKDKRAFFLFADSEIATPMIREGNDCVICHKNEAHFDGTFSDFYPVVRDEILKDRK